MKLRKLLTLLVFFVTNVILNFVDVITDGMTASALCKFIIFSFSKYLMIYNFLDEHHAYWSMLTIFWIFAPFLFHLSIILFKPDDWKTGLKEALGHFPLIVPLKNSYAWFKISQVKYSDAMPVGALREIEIIKMSAGKLTQTEAFIVSLNIQV